MKKKVLAMILGTMLVLSLAACGGSDDATEADATATEETADTEEATEDTEEATDETAAEDVEFAEGDDGPLWSIDMMTEPVDVADTTWSFTGGCIDGEELTDEESQHLWSSTADSLISCSMRMVPQRWYRVAEK